MPDLTLQLPDPLLSFAMIQALFPTIQESLIAP